eukprot:TRINITY_DN25279_c0_g3_i3.p1 TRINITY_DN25279_c0_g3~~TRINITY_DN25279_c0_g3_i3.p1  ORF type:complete len:1102 (-),score=84.26 TRINITY_DN25279_c0_g3_i3:37-3342(-)
MIIFFMCLRASSWAVLGQLARAALLSGLFASVGAGTQARRCADEPGRRLATPSSRGNGTVVLSDASADSSGSDDFRRQLEALREVWRSLQCKASLRTSWPRGEHCPAWASCTGRAIESIYLVGAECTGTLSSPSWLQLRALRLVDLTNNGLTGELPMAWSGMHTLEIIALGYNKLDGALPSAWGNLARLRVLALHCNRFSSKLPADWSRLSNLKDLRIAENALVGPLPAAWSNLGGLWRLYLQNNMLDGTLPADWMKMSQMHFLHLGFNKLEGPLPAEWGNMQNLQELNLNNNKLNSGLKGKATLPAEWSKLVYLQELILNDNELSGVLPVAWANISSLLRLSLSSNELVGPLPADWSKLDGLQVLQLENNMLSGTLPVDWMRMLSLEELHLSHNDLHGPLPAPWGSMPTLRFLYLHNNRFSGPLPPDWSNLGTLSHLNLANNRLSGSFNLDLDRLPELKLLHLSNNRLTGPLPDSLTRAVSIQTLALHGNRFTGRLPRLSAKAPYDAVLLHSNQLVGCFSDIGDPKAGDIVALPGNYLTRDVGKHGAVAALEPFVKANSHSPFFRHTAPPWKMLAMLAAVFAAWFALQMRLPPASLPAGSRADAVLRETFVALQPAVLWHSVLACALMICYNCGNVGLVSMWTVSRHTAAFCRGPYALFAFASSLLSTTCILPRLLTLPRYDASSLPSRQALNGVKRGCCRRIVLWLAMLASCLLVSLPNLLNVLLKSSPQVQPVVFSVLPPLGAVLQVFVQPALLRKLASAAGVPYYELQILQGASSWALPLAVLVDISPECRGSWWRFLDMCSEPPRWHCVVAQFMTGHGIQWKTYCWHNRTLDVPSREQCALRNSTHCMRGLIISTDDICGDRWPDPLRCTSSIIDVIGTFVFKKLLFICSLTLGLLLVASLGKARSPVGLLGNEVADGSRSALACQRVRLGVNRILLSFSAKFTALEALPRLSVWSDLTLSWGLLYPPIAGVGLLYLLVERWCYEKGRCNFRFVHEESVKTVVQMPRSTMIGWFMVANILGAVHVACVAVDEPSSWHFAAALTAVLISWIVGLSRGFGQLQAAPSGHAWTEADASSFETELPATAASCTSQGDRVS